MNQKLLHTPEGVRDIYGAELARKIQIETKLRECTRLFGYEEIQTPTFEFYDIFSNEIGTIPGNELYKFFDKDGNILALRGDFTPSVARCTAQYFCEEKAPLRFSYMGNTFANAANLQGKLNEVTQMGVELINDDSVEADAEMIALAINALRICGLENFRVSVGEAGYFEGLCEEAGIDAATKIELHTLISGKNYFAARELLIGKGVEESYLNIFLKLSDLFGDTWSLQDAKAAVSNQRSIAAVERLEKLYLLLQAYDVASYVAFDLCLLNQYQYYTGVIFKAYTYGLGEAIINGGRYDQLLEKFGKKAPAIGFCIVVDSMLEALRRQKITVETPEQMQTLTYTDDTYSDMLAKAISLRADGVAVRLVKEQ
jgi:ATP phosphoribosyltransferase regulatory subunit